MSNSSRLISKSARPARARKGAAPGPDAVLETSYQLCVEVARKRAKNFHFAFQLLPEERYRGICALYAFARLADDFSDDGGASSRALENARRWRADLDRAVAGDADPGTVLPAVADTLRRFEIAPAYLHDLIAGTEMDARITRYATWPETYRYCYLVASVVGIMTVQVFGFTDGQADARARTLKLAEETGIAFQLTNVLRDIKEDGSRGRIYLPLEDLARFGVSESELLAGKDSPAFRALVRFEVERARRYYLAAGELLPRIAGRGRPALDALVKIYRRLLEEIERRGFDVLSRRVSLSAVEKLRLAGGSALKSLLKN